MSADYKAIKLAPTLYNRKNFYFREHPKLHPDTPTYIRYWEEHEKRSIEGVYILDQAGEKWDGTYNPDKPGGYRYFTPPHYWFTNFTFIKHESEEMSIEVTINPDLRDIDFYWFNAAFKAEGFSGFENDTEVSCHKLLGRYEKYINSTSDKKEFDLSPKETKAWLKLKPFITKPDGSFKKYMDPIEYLGKTFPKKMGKPYYHNNLENIIDLEARGMGKTFKCIGILSQKFNFFGCKTFEQYLSVIKGPILCVGSTLSSKSGELLSKFKFSQDLLNSHFGAWTDNNTQEFIPGFFHKETAGSLKSNNETNKFRHRFKYKKFKNWAWGGTNTSIAHQSYESNPEAFVGNRSNWMLEDEVGLNKNLLKSLQADETVMIMDNKIGWAMKTGTGGNVKKIQQVKKVFLSPGSFGYMEFKDHWEGRIDPIGLFIPAYYQDSTFRDPQGNQDIEAALAQELTVRKKLAQGNSTTALDGYVIARPLVPSEMFLSPEVNIFPTSLLREHQHHLEIKKVFKTIAIEGKLVYDDTRSSGVRWINNDDSRKKTILTYDLKDYNDNYDSNIVLYEPPSDNIPRPSFNKSLYKVVYDPVIDDGSGSSLCAILVYKGYTAGEWNQGVQDSIVATYIGRKEQVIDMHEIAIKLAMYYNAKVLVETNVPDFIRYCKMKNKFNLLQPTPFKAISSFLKSPGAKYDVGIRMGKTLNIHGEQLINQWLREEIGTDPDTGTAFYKLQNIRCPRLIDELINYTRENNTDAVSALKLLMFWIFQEQLVPIKEASEQDTVSKIDRFFGRDKDNKQKNSTFVNNLYHNW